MLPAQREAAVDEILAGNSTYREVGERFGGHKTTVRDRGSALKKPYSFAITLNEIYTASSRSSCGLSGLDFVLSGLGRWYTMAWMPNESGQETRMGGSCCYPGPVL